MEFVQREIFVAGADNYPEAIQYKSGAYYLYRYQKTMDSFQRSLAPANPSKTSWGYGPSARSLDS